MSSTEAKPAPWPELPIRRIGAIVNGGTPRAEEQFWNGSIPFVTPPDLRPVVGGAVVYTERTLTEEGVRTGSTLVPAGSVILSTRAPIGYVARTSTDSALNQGCRAIIPASGLDSRFVAYSLMTSSDYLESIGRGTTFMEISSSQLAEVLLPVPPLGEQQAIADYLDRETQKIDELITEQRGLIETLKERRQAVIDSEFAKLSKSRVALRRYIRFLTSGSRGWGDYYADAGETFVRIGNLPRGGLVLGGERKFVALPPEVTEGQRTILRAGDLLFSITAYIGSVAVVDEDWADSYVSQHVALCRLDEAVLGPKFIGYFALSGEGYDQLSEGAIGGTKVQLALDDIKELRVPLVPLGMQEALVAYLDEQTSRIDELISESEDLIALSQERRAALITAAVTGQIDVRMAA